MRSWRLDTARSTLASAAALLFGLALLAVPAAPVRAVGGSATDWMSEGKFGVMEHYLAENCPLSSDGPYSCPSSAYNTGIFPTIEQWNAQVNNYDVNGVVQQLQSVGAGWLQISVGQNSGYFAAPNAELRRLAEAAGVPPLLTQRDLIKELGDALHAVGLKLIVYTTSDQLQYNHRTQDDALLRALGGDPDHKRDPPSATYQANWSNVIRAWAQQWGTSVDGWWIDGSVFASLAPWYEQLAQTIRSANPNALVSFNGTNVIPSDFTPGESIMSHWPRYPTGRFSDNQGVQVQNQFLGMAQGFWGNEPGYSMTWDADRLIGNTQAVTNVGAAVTWDVGYDRSNGHISDAAMAQLSQVGQALRNAGPITGIAGLCVDVRAASPANGTAIQTHPCNQTKAQKWVITANRRLIAMGKCLDVSGGGTANDTKVQLYDCNNTGAQEWVRGSDGALVNPQSGRCLDVPAASREINTQLQIFDCNRTVAQRWTLP